MLTRVYEYEVSNIKKLDRSFNSRKTCSFFPVKLHFLPFYYIPRIDLELAIEPLPQGEFRTL